MKGYDLNRLAQDLDAWVQQRFLPGLPFMEGGWEAWIQIDFPAHLVYRDGGLPYDFSREVRLPGVGRLDWVVNGHQGTGDEADPIRIDHDTGYLAPAAIEIKAQSVGYPNAAFAALVARDITKLRLLPTLYPQFQHRLMLVAVIDTGAIAALQAQLNALGQPWPQQVVDVGPNVDPQAKFFLIELQP